MLRHLVEQAEIQLVDDVEDGDDDTGVEVETP